MPQGHGDQRDAYTVELSSSRPRVSLPGLVLRNSGIAASPDGPFRPDETRTMVYTAVSTIVPVPPHQECDKLLQVACPRVHDVLLDLRPCSRRPSCAIRAVELNARTTARCSS